MNIRLIIWLPEQAHGVWHYFLSPEVSGVCQTQDERMDLSQHGARETIVIFPGQWARMVALELPKMRAQDRQSAAGFAIEDALGAGLKDQHLVLGASNSQRAVVVSAVKMTYIQNELSAAGITPTGLYADFDVLKPEGMALELDDRIIVTGEQGYSLDPHVFKALPDMPKTQSWDLIALSENVTTDQAINVLQGQFASRRFEGLNVLSLARAAGLVLMLGVVSLIWTGTHARAAKMQAEDMTMQTREIYELATGERAPSNPALAVTRAKRSSGKSEASFLMLSSVLFDAVSDTPSIMIESVQYDSSNARLSVRLIYPSFETASVLEQSVARRGGMLQAGGVREQGDRLVGDGILTLGGGQ